MGEDWGPKPVKSLRQDLWKAPEAVGAALGVGIVIFGILLGFLIRDLGVSGSTCFADRIEQYVLCQLSVQQAQARLPWEICGLLISGGVLGAGLVAWRRHKQRMRAPREFDFGLNDALVTSPSGPSTICSPSGINRNTQELLCF